MRPRRFRWALRGAAFAVLFAAWPALGQETQPSPLAAAHPTEEQVTAAIRKGVDYLLSQQKGGNWETNAWPVEDGRYRYGGLTCLAMYALLHVGQSLDDARLKPRSDELAPSVAWVLQLNPTGSYAASLQANVLALMPRRPESGKQLAKLRDMFLAGMNKDGGYTYGLDPRNGGGGGSDNSCTQYAVLGMWAVANSDIPVPVKYWAEVDKHWRSMASADGWWPYQAGGGANVPMTAAGVASLYLTDEYTDNSLRLESKKDAVLDRGLAYLGRTIPETLKGNANGYYLYGIERVGLASGRKFLGSTNWFAEGADFLIKHQQPNGGFTTTDSDVANGTITTSFALLFLARGRNPVVFNKLQYDGWWDARPRDATNLSNWMSRQFERPINWQVVNMAVSHEEWLDAPVLLITGSKDPDFTPEQVTKLRKFVEAGGLIFSVTDGAKPAFTAAMQHYAEAIVDQKYAWRPIPADHTVYKIYQSMKDPPPLLGVSNGVRELWLHSPQDLGAAWQTKEHASEKEKKDGKLIKERPWDLAANVFFYANGRGSMRSKLQSSAVMETATRPVRNVVIGRLKYKGNWDPEPGAFDRLGRLAFNRWRTALEFKTVEVAELGSAKDISVLYMTGNEKFEFTAEQIAALQKFLDSGGLLVADALNSSSDFDKAFQDLVSKKLYPADKWDVLDNRSTLYFGSLEDTQAIKETHLRPATAAAFGNQTSPRIYALVTSDSRQVRVIYSPFDLTEAYLGTTTADFSGYTSESAERLARNILLYANAVAHRK